MKRSKLAPFSISIVLCLSIFVNVYSSDDDMDQLDPKNEASDTIEATNENFRKLKDTLSTVETDIDTAESDIDDLEAVGIDGVDGTTIENNSGTLRLGHTFGSWTSGIFNLSTLASTDLFLTAVVSDNSNGSLTIKTDSSDPPATIRTRAYSSTGGRGTSCVVKDGEYYLVEDSGATAAVYVIPIGN